MIPGKRTNFKWANLATTCFEWEVFWVLQRYELYSNPMYFCCGNLAFSSSNVFYSDSKHFRIISTCTIVVIPSPLVNERRHLELLTGSVHSFDERWSLVVDRLQGTYYKLSPSSLKWILIFGYFSQRPLNQLQRNEMIYSKYVLLFYSRTSRDWLGKPVCLGVL